MTDREKSVMLAKAMGWDVESGTYAFQVSGIKPPEGDMINNLYKPSKMALAWRVHLWAVDHKVVGLNYIRWFDSGIACWLKEDAQRLWLDRVLELAIEAGIIEKD